MQNLEKSCSLLSGELLELSGKLSKRRREAGDILAEKTLNEIKSLNMPQAGFSVDLRDISEGTATGERKLGPSGADRISFMFTANSGIPMEPLESVASGGELSRVALALAIVLADFGSASTLIFDEIDSGTGGETAHLLAESLLRASESRQIIVISHLAQIASRAQRHLAVEKNYHDGMPVTTVKHLDTSEDRVEELTRLLGGDHGARDHAQRLLEEM
jgi:DNA repair protein RecN (Recombination protein N)